MKEKYTMIVARVLSAISTPFYLPIVGLLALFLFSYLQAFPLVGKVFVLLTTYLFTIFLPTCLIRLYRRYQGWSLLELGVKERRMVPYVISIACYFGCYYLLTMLHIPYLINIILMVALVIQIICAFVNIWWKISTHCAAIGGLAGGLLAYSYIFDFYPLWWFCLVLILGGMVGTSRMMLRQHTLPQVVVGFGVGFFTSLLMILPG